MERHKYPRTLHLPWSPGKTSDDKTVPHTKHLDGVHIVATKKLDGECTSIYSDGYVHARSTTWAPHDSRNWVKALAGSFAHLIPPGWRVVGENMYAKHSIHYQHLDGKFFWVFSVFDDRNTCLAWYETLQWAETWGLPTVPVLYHGAFGEKELTRAFAGEAAVAEDELEGYVVRVKGRYHYGAHYRSTAKYVREGHVQTDDHWLHQAIVRNS